MSPMQAQATREGQDRLQKNMLRTLSDLEGQVREMFQIQRMDTSFQEIMIRAFYTLSLHNQNSGCQKMLMPDKLLHSQDQLHHPDATCPVSHLMKIVRGFFVSYLPIPAISPHALRPWQRHLFLPLGGSSSKVDLDSGFFQLRKN
jgi:hypothetical protein